MDRKYQAVGIAVAITVIVITGYVLYRHSLVQGLHDECLTVVVTLEDKGYKVVEASDDDYEILVWGPVIGVDHDDTYSFTEELGVVASQGNLADGQCYYRLLEHGYVIWFYEWGPWEEVSEYQSKREVILHTVGNHVDLPL